MKEVTKQHVGAAMRVRGEKVDRIKHLRNTCHMSFKNIGEKVNLQEQTVKVVYNINK